MAEFMLFWSELLRGYQVEVLQMPLKTVGSAGIIPRAEPEMLVRLHKRST